MDKNFDLGRGTPPGTHALCDFFAEFATRVWDDLQFARRAGFRRSETTITEQLLLEFWRKYRWENLPIMILEADNEEANGNDLEIAVETEQGYLLFAVQAKVIKKSNKYPTISHTVGGKKQIDLLIDYAASRDALPVYFFYNYTDDYDYIFQMEEAEGTTIEYFGCTVGSAVVLRDAFFIRRGKNSWRIPSFRALHTVYAIPLHWALCRAMHEKLQSVHRFIGYNFDGRVHFHTYEELTNDPYWSEIFPPGQIGFIHSKDEEQLTPEGKEKEIVNPFNPKFRIVLSKEEKRRRPRIRDVS